jgi:hypothetical protein
MACGLFLFMVCNGAVSSSSSTAAATFSFIDDNAHIAFMAVIAFFICCFNALVVEPETAKNL